MCRIHPDGRKDVTVFADPCVMKMMSGNVDLVQKDKDGNIIIDSRRDRIEKKRELAQLARLYSSNIVAASLLASYQAAVNDPENELVHLYEIRDALSKLFKGEVPARKALGLGVSEWRRLGQLANDEPLKQGRHRGKSAGELRDATESEPAEARIIALLLLKLTWFIWMETNNKPLPSRSRGA